MSLPAISIIIGFKNRELERVKYSLDSLANQTIKDFDLVFIDYGSDDSVAKAAKELVSEYSFAKYYYSDARGWFWTRAHALNTGLQYATGQIILFSDIDLVLESNFLSKVAALDYTKLFYTFSCYYLPEHYDLQQLINKGDNFSENYVGLCAVNSEQVKSIGGFDEYYMVWGVEDDDLYYRLSQNELLRKEQPANNFKVYHQWHPEFYNKLPAAWYNHMIYYYSLHRKNDVYPNYSKAQPQRYLFAMIENAQYEKYIEIKLKSKLITAFQNFWVALEMMLPEEIRWFRFSKKDNFAKGKLKDTIPFINKLLGKQQLFNYRFIRKEEAGSSINITPEDVRNALHFFVGVNRHIIKDYYYREDETSIVFIFKKV